MIPSHWFKAVNQGPVAHIHSYRGHGLWWRGTRSREVFSLHEGTGGKPGSGDRIHYLVRKRGCLASLQWMQTLVECARSLAVRKRAEEGFLRPRRQYAVRCIRSKRCTDLSGNQDGSRCFLQWVQTVVVRNQAKSRPMVREGRRSEVPFLRKWRFIQERK